MPEPVAKAGMIDPRGVSMIPIRCWTLAGLSALIPVLAVGESAATRLDGPHLLKSHGRASSLVVADLNNDGRPDIATISNDEGLMRIYYRAEPGSVDEIDGDEDEGDTEGEEPFRREEITLDRAVRAMAAVDVNGNGRKDLVLAGGDSSLAIYIQGDDGRMQLNPDVNLRANRLVASDLAGDGHEDLILVGNNRIQIVPGSAEGLDFDNPRVFFTPTTFAGDPLVLDLDGDGRLDLAYVPTDNRDRVHVRLQNENGDFPSEFALRTGQVRGLDAIRMTGRRDILAAVQGQTRQVVLIELADPASTEADEARLILSDPRFIGFDPDRRDNAPFATIADVDGDGRADIVIEMPGTASLRVVRQTEAGSLVPAEFPCYRDVRTVVAWPVEEGQPAPLLLISGSEKALGVTIATSGERLHVPFPSSLRTTSRPLAAGIARIDAEPTLVVIEEGPDAKTAFVRSYPEFDPTTAQVGPSTLLTTLSDLRELPRYAVVADVDRDGADDMILFFEYAPPSVLRQNGEGEFEALEPTGLLAGLLASSAPANFSSSKLAGMDSETVLVARDEFVRAFSIDESGIADITQQFNGQNSRAQVRSATVANLRSEDSREVVLFDAANNVLTIYGTPPDSDAYNVLRHVDIAAAGYRAVHALDIDGDGKDDLVLVSPDRMAVIYSRVLNGSLDSLDSVETGVENGGYGMVRALNLSAAGEPNLVALEMRRAVLDFFKIAADDEDGAPSLKKFRTFRVFDSEMSIAGRANLDASPEPREIATADLTGNGNMDLIALVHDYIIVYYQEESTPVSGDLAMR